MSSAQKKPVREAGGITVAGKWETRMLVDRAFAKEEEVTWNTLKERRDGKSHWSGAKEIIAIPEEMSDDWTPAQWETFCAKDDPKGGRNKDPIIIPTRPHRPLNQNGRDTNSRTPRRTNGGR